MRFPSTSALFVAIIVIESILFFSGNLTLMIWRGVLNKGGSDLYPSTRDIDDGGDYHILTSDAFSYISEEKVYGNSTNVTGLETCPAQPPNLVSKVHINLTEISWDMLNKHFVNSTIELGGRWRPPNCKSRHHVAILVPYRDRESMLRKYLSYIHPFLQKQLLHYGVYVSEQDHSNAFNRGMLLNVGFVEALKISNYSCFVMSDVDMLPENEHNSYGCPAEPLHLSPVRKIDNTYRKYYRGYFGGVTSFRTEHFKLVNGFSNKYFGWGGEDDDLFRRILRKGFKMNRPPNDTGRYVMLSHPKEKASGGRKSILKKSWRRSHKDGLNNLHYYIQSFKEYPLYTQITVSLGESSGEVIATPIPTPQDNSSNLDKDMANMPT